MPVFKVQPNQNASVNLKTPAPLKGTHKNWDEYFALAKPRLRARAEGFQKIFDYTKENLLDDLCIVETGTYREINNYEGDGCSTLLFDHFVKYNGGKLYSVDIDNAACILADASTEKAQVVRMDSVEYLNEFDGTISVLYLDSYNIQNWNHDHDAAAHHLKELFVCKEKLKDGALVVIDDNIKSPFNKKLIGKGRLIYEVLHDVLNMEHLVDDYQQAFIWNS